MTLDWRVTEPDKLVHVPDKLPMDYLNKLHQMLDELGLNFGAFDIIRDEDDRIKLAHRRYVEKMVTQ
ncbi:hypothetical protein QUA40_04120 [Microcoleus sp. Pol11C3]|uniref:hypothetical protein n=1 Tax=Microcoleus sp. Pol11C3 TaxID=3055390 RepID=UPI002FD6DF1F